jgi:4-hydroxy-2-oxoheptanedioate aldolase
MGLKTRLAAGDRLLGVLLRMPAEELVEMCAVAGFHFVLIDGEHGPVDVIGLRSHLALAETHGVPVLVRVGRDEPGAVLRVLDAGAEGVVAPHVDTADQARALVDAAHYPPLGHRGFATYGRAGRFGLTEPARHLATERDRTLVIGMIESPLGVAQAAEIVAVPGLDGIMVGAADLGASSGPDDPDPADGLRAVHDVLADQGAMRMDVVTSTEAARSSFADGAQLVVYNLTATIMGHLAELRGAR